MLFLPSVWPPDPVNMHDLSGEKVSIAPLSDGGRVTSKNSAPVIQRAVKKASRPTYSRSSSLFNYETLTNISKIANITSLVSGAIGGGAEIAAAFMELSPAGLLAMKATALLAGTVSIGAAWVATGADCVAHKLDAICIAQLPALGMATMFYAAGLTKVGGGAGVGGTIFSISQFAIWQLVPSDGRPHI
ncbi:hypothetical protein [Microbacterium sp. OVT16B]|uniref:hypothetical protein n=1 Tax=Microbacterium sp. OVT16B TaxID=2862682 RepID=UPI001CBD875B|nr:hypothetical protein [Microbacterium sp. OVT16B]